MRDLSIHTQDLSRLRDELAHIVEYFQGLGDDQCEVLFGFAWHIEADTPEISWRSVQLQLASLDTEIRAAEAAGLERFAHDDVWLSFENRALKVQFCHHEGIHLSYSEPDDITAYFFARWQASGLEPIESENFDNPPKWRRIPRDGA